MEKLIGNRYYHYERGELTVVGVSAKFREVTLRVDRDYSTLLRPVSYLDDLERLPSMPVKLAWCAIYVAAGLAVLVLLT